jgi:hypothetical protein
MTVSGRKRATTPQGVALSNTFIGGDGVAVALDGTIYVDTNTGNSFTSVSAIIAITPNGRSSRTLWKS